MEEKEPTLKDLARMVSENSQGIAENTRTISEVAELVRALSIHVDERFEHVHQELNDFKQETADNFRQVHREVADLREVTMPLEEQSELRLRVHRIEDHLGLPHEVKPA
jgi:methyl-accepting chemotaxis protein